MNRSKFVSTAVAMAAGVLFAGAANAQYGYGNPYTGAGSTSRPYYSPQMQQQQQANAAQRQADDLARQAQRDAQIQRWQNANAEIARQQYRFSAPSGYYGVQNYRGY